MDKQGHTFSQVTRHTLVIIGLVALALALWTVVEALLFLFLGALIAILFRGTAKWVAGHTGISVGKSLIGVTVLALLALAAGIWLLGASVSEQLSQLTETLPQSVESMRGRLEQSQLGRVVVKAMQDGGGSGGASGMLGVAFGAFGAVGDLILTLFAAAFFAANPGLYVRGILLLVPKHHTRRVGEAVEASGHALWRWVLGQFIAMLFVGVATAVGLSLVGAPLPLVLGLIAGLFDFVPIVGPIVAAIPGVLLAFTAGPSTALYAALVYLVVQQLEGNLVTPLIQQKMISLPPVLVLFAVIAAGLLLGIPGVIVATPLALLIMVLVRMLYVQDVLGKDVTIPGESD